MAQPAAVGQLRSDISRTPFLSEPDAYDGGELIGSDTCGEHKVKLPAGDLIVYASGSLHRVQPVSHGPRLPAFFRVQSRSAMTLSRDCCANWTARSSADWRRCPAAADRRASQPAASMGRNLSTTSPHMPCRRPDQRREMCESAANGSHWALWGG
jgi:hypothetical protein